MSAPLPPLNQCVAAPEDLPAAFHRSVMVRRISPAEARRKFSSLNAAVILSWNVLILEG